MKELITIFAHLHIQNELAPQDHFIIPQYIASYIPNYLLNFITTATILLSLIVITRKVYLFLHARSHLKQIIDASLPCERLVNNPILLNRLIQSKIMIRTSNTIDIPFAAKFSYIFIPLSLSRELSQDEFHSVIVHELEHLRWKDPIFKMACDLLCAIFWWLPSSWWLERLELEQEDACDAEVYKYGIDPSSLASAIIKVIKKAKFQKYQLAAVSTFDSPKNSHLRRINNLLNIKKMNCYNWQFFIGTAACLVASLSFWMC